MIVNIPVEMVKRTDDDIEFYICGVNCRFYKDIQCAFIGMNKVKYTNAYDIADQIWEAIINRLKK